MPGPSRCIWSLLAVALMAALPSQGQPPSDGREWAEAGGAFDPAKTLAELPPGYRAVHQMVAMRDGVRMATTAFIPPGEGRWSAVVVRTPYGRAGGAKSFAAICAQAPRVCVVQDLRGSGGSEGKPLADPVSSDNEIADSYDTVEWVVQQSWCDGRVGIMGGSGNGMAAAMAYLSKHPNLAVVDASNTAPNTALHWAFENGVRRKLYGWLTHRGLRPAEWPRPTLLRYDHDAWERAVAAAAEGNRTVLLASDGWFNIFGDASLRLYEAFAPKGHVFVTMRAAAHGTHCDRGVKFSIQGGAGPPWPTFLGVLDGSAPPPASRVRYAVLGDVSDPAAPGNAMREAPSWPPPHTPLTLYLRPPGELAREVPPEAGSARYLYDPADPVPSLGGGWSFGNDPNGAVDQRPLAGRPDIARFVSPPLERPLEIAGPVRADLWISSSAPDTLFVVKLVDIYPDGREILLLEAAAMARFRDGCGRPAPLVPGEPALLSVDCKSIAAAFNTGHRIGAFITSSSHPAYEVHPNSFEPAGSEADLRTAEQTIHAAPERPSAIVLPQIAP